MAATKADIINWYNHSYYVDNATNMAVFMDWFDYSDYPAYYVAKDSDDLMKQLRNNPDRLMEVYSYAVPLEDQIDLSRCFNYKVAK